MENNNSLPFVMLNLDKPRKFRFDLGAMIELKERTGANLLKPEGAPLVFGDPALLLVFIHLGLRAFDENHDLEEADIKKLVALDNFAEFTEVVMETVMGKKEKGVARKIPSRRNRGTGTSPSKQPSAAGSDPPSSTN